MLRNKYCSAFLALFVMSGVFVLVSCEKPLIGEEKNAVDTKGNLRVSVFQIEKMPLASLFPGVSQTTTRGAQAVSEVCTRLNFAVYDIDDSRVKQVNQTIEDRKSVV